MENKNEKFTFKIPDMSCQHCKMRIIETLKQIPQITDITVDLNLKEVTVVTSGDLSRQTIIDTLDEIGYTPE